MATSFKGEARPLSEQGLANATEVLGIGLPEIWAVLSVETSGAGFLADKRPKILFERHVFHKQTDGRFDQTEPNLSNPAAGGYGAGGANQYARLERAIALDRQAALNSASWGIAQVMGFNATSVGFAGAEEMIARFEASEDVQLGAMATFIKAKGIDADLRAHDWAGFARVYNGPSFARNEYDKKLATFHAKYAQGAMPDLALRAAQLYLAYCGFNPGPVDGLMGSKTRKALETFQQRQGLAVSGAADPATLQALEEQAAGV